MVSRSAWIASSAGASPATISRNCRRGVASAGNAPSVVIGLLSA